MHTDTIKLTAAQGATISASPQNLLLIAVRLMPAKILSEAQLSKGDLWVFGYGSLMWQPGFPFIEQVPARLIGEHRALCVYSFDHRGTPEKPGLVLGLDRGGACRGIAFRIESKLRNDTVAYLPGPDQTTNANREGMRSLCPANQAPGRVRSTTVEMNAMNSRRDRPGGKGSRNSTTSVPGYRMKVRRGQNSPELSAAGRQGTPQST